MKVLNLMCFSNINCKKIKGKLIILYLFLPSILFAGDENIILPDMGDSSSNVFSQKYEKRLSQMFMKQIRRFSVIFDDPEIESYIQSCLLYTSPSPRD